MKLVGSICMVLMAGCVGVVQMASTTMSEVHSSNFDRTEVSDMTTLSTTTSSNTSTPSSDETRGSSLSSSIMSTTPSNVSSSTTSSTTRPSTTPMPSLIECKNGSCVGNVSDSSCLNDTITDVCVSSEHCYQIVFTNSTNSVYEVGCKESCEYLLETAEGVTRTTRCCNTKLCNEELLPDPEGGSGAVNVYMSAITLSLVITSCRIFN